jgi:diadenosine tetraphosphate (Ap4A) HIT family hydrolase
MRTRAVKVGGWHDDPYRSSLGLLPSGPDPVGEWFVHHQPPGPDIVQRLANCKAAREKCGEAVRTSARAGHGVTRMASFTLDERLENDSIAMASLGLCQVRLMNDARWPWIILVPQRDGMSELHDLSPLDQTMLTFELGMAGKALKDATGCLKLNIGALGNHVRQLHMHVIARNEGDEAWPGPVWGVGTRTPYGKEDARSLIASILAKL